MTRRTAIAALALGLALAPSSPAARAPMIIEDLQHEGRVIVTADGNGITSASFPTTVDGEDVTYYLDVRNGCASPLDEELPCPSVRALNVTLNDEVVLQKSAFAVERIAVHLHLVGTSDNQIQVSADGERGAGARFAILAARPGQP